MGKGMKDEDAASSSTSEVEKTPQEIRTECLGGWAFLLLAIGVIGVTPCAIALVGFIDDTEHTAEYYLVIAFFAFICLCTFFGIMLIIIWCRQARYNRKEDMKDEERDSNKNKSDKKNRRSGGKTRADSDQETISQEYEIYAKSRSNTSDINPETSNGTKGGSLTHTSSYTTDNTSGYASAYAPDQKYTSFNAYGTAYAIPPGSASSDESSTVTSSTHDHQGLALPPDA